MSKIQKNQNSVCIDLSKSELAPVCLFVYNRLDETRKTINFLKKNLPVAPNFYDHQRIHEQKLQVYPIQFFHNINLFHLMFLNMAYLPPILEL